MLMDPFINWSQIVVYTWIKDNGESKDGGAKLSVLNLATKKGKL